MSTGSKIVVGMVVLGAIAGMVALNLKGGRKKGQEVEVEPISRRTITSTVSCTGAIEARRKVDISANVMGEIINLAVKEGDRVEKDQFLLQIDRTQLMAQNSGNRAAIDALRADAEAARANATQARLEFERAERNFRDRIIAEAELQRARAGYDSATANVRALERRIEQAKATLEGSKDSLEKTTIRAPIAGTVTALPVEAGEIAVIGTMNNAGTKLMTISDMSVIEAHMEVDETDIPRVELGQVARITIDAYPGKVFEGAVSEIASSPIERVGNQAIEFAVKIVIHEPPATIRPGFSVSADITTGVRQDVLAIPVQALVVQDMASRAKSAEAAQDASSTLMAGASGVHDDVEGVYTIEADKVKFLPVELGLQGDLVVEALSGIDQGLTVVTGPFRVLRALKDGDPVHVKEDEEKDKDKKSNKDPGASPS